MHEFVLAEGLILKEVGKRYGINNQRVRQLFKKFEISTVKQAKSQEIKDKRCIRKHIIPFLPAFRILNDKNLTKN